MSLITPRRCPVAIPALLRLFAPFLMPCPSMYAPAPQNSSDRRRSTGKCAPTGQVLQRCGGESSIEWLQSEVLPLDVSLANSLCVRLGIGTERRPDLDLAELETVSMLGLELDRLLPLSEEIKEKLDEEKELLSMA